MTIDVFLVVFLQTGGVALWPFFAIMVTAMADLLMQGLTPERQELVRPVITLYQNGLIEENVMINTLQNILENANRTAGQTAQRPAVPRTKAPPLCATAPEPASAPLRAAGGPQASAPLRAAGPQVTYAQAAASSMQSGPMHMPPLEGMVWDPATGLFYYTEQTVKGQGRGRGKGQGKDKSRGKDRGKKGGGQKGEGVYAQSFESAEQSLKAFLVRNPNFVFRTRDDLPKDLEPVWKVLAEHNDRMYKNLRKHFDQHEELHDFLREMAEGTRWPVDRWNEVEQSSAKKNRPMEGRLLCLGCLT